jgi:hypothetical protein
LPLDVPQVETSETFITPSPHHPAQDLIRGPGDAFNGYPLLFVMSSIGAIDVKLCIFCMVADTSTLWAPKITTVSKTANFHRGTLFP